MAPKFVIATVALACATGCRSSVTDSSVVGTYKCTQWTTGHADVDEEFKNAKITLEVRPDHTYREVINDIVPLDGTWALTDRELVLTPKGVGFPAHYDVQGNTLSDTKKKGTTVTFQKG